MLRLYGFASSNYHNIVKLVLLEKGLPFEEITTHPPADEAYRSKNPTRAIYGEDLLAALPVVRRHREMMGERESRSA